MKAVKKKKKLKGMTLVEIIISLAVFAMVSLILCLMGECVDANRREATRVNRKVNTQGPIAEAQKQNDALLVNDDHEIVVSVSGSDKAKTTIKGKLYSTVPYTVDADGKNVIDPDAPKANLKFVTVEMPDDSTPVTPASPGP